MSQGPRLVMLGKQGAGKGTQAARVAEHYRIVHLSTGELFRAAAHAGTAFGVRAKEYMDRGELVPDETVVGLIEERFTADGSPLRGGFVLDGFPRNLAQAEALDAMLAGIDRGLDAILFFDVSDEIGMERALSRAEIEGRSDDTPEVIAKRLAVYHEQTEPIVEHYRATGKLVPLHADRTIDEVWAEIVDALQVVTAA